MKFVGFAFKLHQDTHNSEAQCVMCIKATPHLKDYCQNPLGKVSAPRCLAEHSGLTKHRHKDHLDVSKNGEACQGRQKCAQTLKGTILDPIWSDFELILESFWGHFGFSFEGFWCLFGFIFLIDK